jgi:integrase
MLALRWKDVDLASGWLTVGDAKTDAGRRKVKIRGVLRDELLGVRQRRLPALPSAFVFPTGTGARTRAENYRKRVLKPSVALADKRREGVDLPPLPERLTPHSLRRTFCSLLYALGETPPVVMQEMGHTDAKLALNVYAQVMRRDESEKSALAALMEGADPRLASGLASPRSVPLVA